ncbi:MAG: DUF1778 domain-containing protein [Magnetococcales bacterium]|nr:DUF1778 domain-containing protein [Magnetococcales bacterium]
MATSQARIDLRIKADLKDLFTKAAQLTGTNLSSFIVASTMEKAKQVIKDQETLQLSNKDRDIFLNALENPSKPNSRLQKAAKDYDQRGFLRS